MSDMVSASTNKLEDTLLDIIVCPVDKGSLSYSYFDDINEPILANLRLKKYYEIKDSIPILLQEESKDLNNDQIDLVTKNLIRTTGRQSSN